MRAAIILPPKGFKDETVSFFKSFFAKWGITPSIASYNNGECVGYHGAAYKADISALKVNPDEFDIILVPEGPGIDAYKLYDYKPLLDTLRAFSSAKKTLIATGNAVSVLARASALVDTKVAVHENSETVRLVRIYHGIISNKPLESDKNVITAKSSDSNSEIAKLVLEKFGLK